MFPFVIFLCFHLPLMRENKVLILKIPPLMNEADMKCSVVEDVLKVHDQASVPVTKIQSTIRGIDLYF